MRGIKNIMGNVPVWGARSAGQRAVLRRAMLVLLICVARGESAVISTTRPAITPADAPAFWAWAPTPPMGWNSWDCYGAGVNEQQTLANADYMAEKLKPHGWKLITVDIQWYEPLAHTTEYRRDAALEMDGFGRLLPAANRFPSTAATRSFKPIADALHAKGLTFGLHLLRGIPRQAVARDLPIFGTHFSAADIADTRDRCKWNGDMFGVDMTRAGAQEYYDSVFQLLASWNVDFVKVDDLSRPYHTAEIEAIRRAIDRSGRPMVLSTSPGATPLAVGEHVQTHANQWRISDDFWDSWPALLEQFARLDAWTPYRAAGHFPDADMLPVGNLRTWEKGWTHFTQDEQVTLLTLWSIARSPLIVGANLPGNDPFTLNLLTNDAVIDMDQHSTGNRQVRRSADEAVWTADAADGPGRYVALFNTSASTRTISVGFSELGLGGRYGVRDLWSGKDLEPAASSLSASVPSHGAALYRLLPN